MDLLCAETEAAHNLPERCTEKLQTTSFTSLWIRHSNSLRSRSLSQKPTRESKDTVSVVLLISLNLSSTCTTGTHFQCHILMKKNKTSARTHTHLQTHRLTHKVTNQTENQFLEASWSSEWCQTISPVAKYMYSWRGRAVFRCWTVAGTAGWLSGTDVSFKRASAGSSSLFLEALRTGRGHRGRTEQAWEEFGFQTGFNFSPLCLQSELLWHQTLPTAAWPVLLFALTASSSTGKAGLKSKHLTVPLSRLGL